MQSFHRAVMVLVVSSVVGLSTSAHAVPCSTYQDLDGDTYGNPSVPSANCPTTGWVINNTDCDDTNSNRYPGNTETVGNNVDNDCDGEEICYLDNDNDDARSNSTIVSTANTNCADAGEAVSGALQDCNDSNATMYPGNVEIPGNQVDNDCNLQEICYLDNDNDGYRPNPSATVTSVSDSDCVDPGEALSSDPTTDCNDNNFNIHPFATENVNDGMDFNCDGFEVCYLDNDNDGYRPNPSATKLSPNLLCAGPGDAVAADPTTDCNDNSSAVNPAEAEICDGIDNDCSGAADEGICSASDSDAGDAGDAGNADGASTDAGSVGGGDGDGDGDSDSGSGTVFEDSGVMDPSGIDAASADGSSGALPPDAVPADAGEPPTGHDPNDPDGSPAAGGSMNAGSGSAQDAGSLASDGDPTGAEDATGCNCRTAGRSNAPPIHLAWLVLLGLTFLRRTDFLRRRSSR